MFANNIIKNEIISSFDKEKIVKKNIIGSIFIIFGIILAGCFLFQSTGAFTETEIVVQPPNFQRASIAVLIFAFVYWGGFLWFKSYVEKRSKKDNIAQLRLLNRKLFGSFNNFIKEGGLFEKAWSSFPASKEDGEFQRVLSQARDIMTKESIEKHLIVFESTAGYVLSKNPKMIPKAMDNCEREGLAMVVRLLGYDFAKREFLKLKHDLRSASERCWAIFDDDVFNKAHANTVDIAPFEIQLDRVRKFILSRNDLYEPPGLLASIDKLSKIIRNYALLE